MDDKVAGEAGGVQIISYFCSHWEDFEIGLCDDSWMIDSLNYEVC
jgi:hypothetical protein